MARRLAVLVGRAIADGGANDDEGGPRRLRCGGAQSFADGVEVGVTLGHVNDLPTVGLEALAHVFVEGQGCGAIQGDLVRVVEVGELSQPQVASQRGRFRRDALHQIAIGHQGVSAMVHQRVARTVEVGG